MKIKLFAWYSTIKRASNSLVSESLCHSAEAALEKLKLLAGLSYHDKVTITVLDYRPHRYVTCIRLTEQQNDSMWAEYKIQKYRFYLCKSGVRRILKLKYNAPLPTKLYLQVVRRAG